MFLTTDIIWISLGQECSEIPQSILLVLFNTVSPITTLFMLGSRFVRPHQWPTRLGDAQGIPTPYPRPHRSVFVAHEVKGFVLSIRGGIPTRGRRSDLTAQKVIGSPLPQKQASEINREVPPSEIKLVASYLSSARRPPPSYPWGLGVYRSPRRPVRCCTGTIPRPGPPRLWPTGSLT